MQNPKQFYSMSFPISRPLKLYRYLIPFSAMVTSCELY